LRYGGTGSWGQNAVVTGVDWDLKVDASGRSWKYGAGEIVQI
jgi:hypothetical protein